MMNNRENSVNYPPKILVISGATATGKSDLALEIAEKFNGFIINADALQIYKNLPILSAQPAFENSSSSKNIEFFLYGIYDHHQKNSVGIWLDLVKEIIVKNLEKKSLPIVVGGSGMYISCLIDGINKIPQIDEKFRIEAEDLYRKIGHQEFLQKFGNEKIIDKQKLLRACEIYLQTGKKIEFFHAQAPQKIFENSDFIHVNLDLPRQKIYENCDSRFTKMLKNGALEEVKNYLEKINDLNSPITKTLGFNEIVAYLNQKITFAEMNKLATQKTRNYAKRQLTWFRHQFSNINFFDERSKILQFCQKILAN